MKKFWILRRSRIFFEFKGEGVGKKLEFRKLAPHMLKQRNSNFTLPQPLYPCPQSCVPNQWNEPGRECDKTKTTSFTDDHVWTFEWNKYRDQSINVKSCLRQQEIERGKIHTLERLHNDPDNDLDIPRHLKHVIHVILKRNHDFSLLSTSNFYTLDFL